jgi:predicted dehydrogenase
MRYRAAIIGCGRIGSEFADDPLIQGIYSHAEAYTVSSGTDLVAVCDTDPGKREQCRKRWGVADSFSDHREMLSAVRPDIVSVCTPDSTHYRILSDILAAPGIRAVIAEKPLALTLSEAETIVSLAERKKVLLAVNYFRRYAANHREVAGLVRDRDRFGQVQAVSGFYSKGILHNGTHWIDLARFLIGEIVSVRGYDSLKEEEKDQTLDALLEFDTGVLAYLHGCDEGSFTIFEMDIVGKKGRVRLTDSGNTVEYCRVTEDPHYSGYSALNPERTDQGGFGDVLLHVVDDLVDCLQTGRKQPACSGRDGLMAVAIAAGVARSAQINQEIRISPLGRQA